MTIETWCCINDQGEAPHQNLPLAKGFDAKQTWKVFWREYRRCVGSTAFRFMLVLKYLRQGREETINVAMGGLSFDSYAAIMYARGVWGPEESFREY